jgi:eukaryotic-like serine/threonine-protein kinase
VVKLIAGKYEVRGVLGEGGTGVVYDAVRKDDGAAVALKVMHAELAGDRQIRGRFQREAAILRRLEGPHICPILDFGEVPSDDPARTLLYIALPKLAGPSLEKVLESDGPLPVDRVLDIVLEVLEALRSAHGQGVIHRDLKPANVILKDGDKVVVVDFGMSKIVTGTGIDTTNLTAHNMVFGTPEYMSPEQARGDELDARCDVYAAGIMLYEMLTGSPPFRGATPLTVLTAHLTSDIEPPSMRSSAGRVSRGLESVVMHALARDRDLRYPSASAFAAAILHARAAPDDVESLRPDAFGTSPQGTDAFAQTMPAIASPMDSGRPPPIIVDGEGAARVTPGPRETPYQSSRPPAPGGSVRPPAPYQSSRPPAPGGSVRPPAPGEPSRPLPRASSRPPPLEAESNRMWIALWVVAAILSIGAGVYFALR